MKTLATVSVLVALVVPATASAKGNCPTRSGTLATDALGRIWHRASSVYGCTTVFGHSPRTRRLGPYKTGVRVAFDGVNVAFTVPLVRNGVRSDRLYAVNVDSGSRWLAGRLLVPATAGSPEREARVQALKVSDQSIAWVTRTADVVMATRSPEDTPVAIGTLPRPLTVDRKLLLVGSFPDTAAGLLAQSMQLKEEPGDGDECGGVNPYTLTVKPNSSAGPIGVRWFGGWTSTNCK